MENKRDYKVSIRTARRFLRVAILTSVKTYRREVRKQKLFLQQALAKQGLKEMGVPNRQIPVTVVDGGEYKINVRIGV